MADRFRTPRKEKEWACIPSFVQAMTANATFATGALAFASSATVMRMLGEYVITPTAAPGAGDQVKVTIGIGKVSTDAATAGAGSLPDPAEECEYPWLYWAEHSFLFSGTQSERDGGAGVVRVPFDIRSMRKFKPRESLVFIFQYTDIVGAPPLTFLGSQTRTLIALS